MKGKFQSIEIKGTTIKKGSIVNIDIWGDGKDMEVTVLDIYFENGNTFIESVTNYGSIITHSAEQWEDMLVKKK